LDDWTQHVAERQDGSLLAVSETGAFHIERLHLNRQPLVAYRHERRLLEESRLCQVRLLEGLRQLEDQVQALTTQLEQLMGDPNHG
jgi:hypothetical protein